MNASYMCTFGYHPRVMFHAKNSIRVAVGKTKLDGCIVLNEHNTVFASNRPAIWNWCFPGHTRVLDANGISIVSAVFSGSLGDRPTDRLTDHSTRSVTSGVTVTVKKSNSVIVYGCNKYLLEHSTRQIGSTSAISSYIQL